VVHDERPASGDEWHARPLVAADNPQLMSAPSSAMHRTRQAGFTLIELMIAVAVIAILLGVALPSFMDSMRKSRRSEAFTAIAAVQQAQERWRSSNPSYATLSQLNIPTTTPKGYYTLSMGSVNNAAVEYIVKATAAGGQASDTNCAVMEAKLNSGNLTFGAGASSADYTDPNRCWAR